MDGYSLLLFAHIVFVIVWLGSAVLLQILAARFDRGGDSVGLEKLFESLAALSKTLFVPSSLLVVIFGIALTIDGPWSFEMLWIVLGLVGFALTFMTGLLWLTPQSERVKELIDRDGELSPEAQAIAKRMFVVARIDSIVLFLIVFDMAIKPTGDDAGALVLMAAIFLAGAAYLFMRARSIEIPSVKREPQPVT